MKKQLIVILFLMALVAGCKKYDQKHLPVSGFYQLRGDSATYFVNGVPELVGSTLIISTGIQYGWSISGDTLFKNLWTGDQLTIISKTYTSVSYIPGNGGQAQLLVDSSSNNHVSITVQ